MRRKQQSTNNIALTCLLFLPALLQSRIVDLDLLDVLDQGRIVKVHRRGDNAPGSLVRGALEGLGGDVHDPAQDQGQHIVSPHTVSPRSHAPTYEETGCPDTGIWSWMYALDASMF